MRSQEIRDVFLEKVPATASSQRPRCCYGVLVGDSLRSHDTFTALTLLALRCHGVRTVLSRRLHCADGVASQKVCKYQEL